MMTIAILSATSAHSQAVGQQHYLPDNESIVIDMTGFAGPMTGQWFNPIDGSLESIGGVIGNTADYTFLRPAGWEDAVLTLAAVPEPGSAGLTAGGMLSFLLRRRSAAAHAPR